MDADFIGRITYIAQRARAEGYEDVCAWMQRHVSEEIRQKRERPERRGIAVRLANGSPAFLALSRVKEAKEVEDERTRTTETSGGKRTTRARGGTARRNRAAPTR